MFRAIAERIYATSGRFRSRQADVRADNGEPAVPDVTALAGDAARALLNESGFESTVRGNGSVVVRQSPVAGTRSPRHTAVELTMSDESIRPGWPALMPDVRGQAIRRAFTQLALLHLEVMIQGSGVVVAQDPKPREQVRGGTRVLLRCEPKNLSFLTSPH